MKRPSPVLVALFCVVAACTAPTPRLPKVTELPVGEWTRMEPGGDTTCIENTPYAFWVRPGTDSKLVIFFQGGGMCWNEGNCLQEEGYDHDVDFDVEDPANQDNPRNLRGIFDFDDQRNPLAAHSYVFIPYCSGDLHWGDYVATYTTTDGTPTPVSIYHRGMVNAQSALEWVYESYPAPDSILVAGCSAGSAGSIFHAAHIAQHYPESTTVTQLGDSAAVCPPFDFDAPYAAYQNFPPDCPELQEVSADGLELWELYAAVSQCNQERTFAQFNFAFDDTQRSFYIQLGGRPRDFPGLISQSLNQIDRETSNFSYYTVLNRCPAGQLCHCILNKDLFYSLKVDGKLLRDWVQELDASGEVTSSISGTATIDLGP